MKKNIILAFKLLLATCLSVVAIHVLPKNNILRAKGAEYQDVTNLVSKDFDEGVDEAYSHTHQGNGGNTSGGGSTQQRQRDIRAAQRAAMRAVMRFNHKRTGKNKKKTVKRKTNTYKNRTAQQRHSPRIKGKESYRPTWTMD